MLLCILLVFTHKCTKPNCHMHPTQWMLGRTQRQKNGSYCVYLPCRLASLTSMYCSGPVHPEASVTKAPICKQTPSCACKMLLAPLENRIRAAFVCAKCRFAWKRLGASHVKEFAAVLAAFAATHMCGVA